MKLYKVQAVIGGRMGKAQFQNASYQAHEALLDAGWGGVTVSRHSVLRDTTVIELEPTLEQAEGAVRTASITLAQLLLFAEGYYEGLEEAASEEEDLEALEDADDVGPSREAVLEPGQLEDDGYGEEAFALLYAVGFFAPAAPGGDRPLGNAGPPRPTSGPGRRCSPCRSPSLHTMLLSRRTRVWMTYTSVFYGAVSFRRPVAARPMALQRRRGAPARWPSGSSRVPSPRRSLAPSFEGRREWVKTT